MTQRPIGILDSGIGGLTVWKEIVTLLPFESTLYIADSAHCPYGEKPIQFIRERGEALIRYLLSHNAKLIVIACNTVTVVGIDVFRKKFPTVPIVGIVPVVKTAAQVSRAKKIGILSTTRTAESEYQKRLIQAFAFDCTVVNIGTNKLVPCIERCEISEREIKDAIADEIAVFRKTGIDTLALGCSHYPFIKDILQKELGENVLILDSGQAVARHVKRVLEKEGLLGSGVAKHEFFTTGSSEVLKKMIDTISGHDTIQAQTVSL